MAQYVRSTGEPEQVTRSYVRVSPDTEAQVIAYKTLHPLDSYVDIGDALGLPERAVKYILTDLPRLRRNAGDSAASLKQRIMWTLEVLDEGFADITELRRVLGRADSDHDIVHVLHSLHKEGKVDFNEKGAAKEPIRIRITARGRGAALPKTSKQTEERTERTETKNEETETQSQAPITAPTVDEGFPLLDALLLREKSRLDHDSKAMAYIAAAEALEATDPEMARVLTEKAGDFNVTFPSPIESEYLRYVAAHPHTGEPADAPGGHPAGSDA